MYVASLSLLDVGVAKASFNRAFSCMH